MGRFHLYFSVVFLVLLGTSFSIQAANIINTMSPILAAINNGIEGPNDFTPNPFAFETVHNVSRNSLITSNNIRVTGINVPTPISIINGEYSINGGPFITTSGEVLRGQDVCVRVKSSANYSTISTAILNIGGLLGKFKAITGSPVTIFNDTAHYDTHDYFNVVGELRNDTPYHLRLLRIGGSLIDSNQQLIDVDTTYMWLDVLAPGEITCFKLTFQNHEGATHYWIEPPTYWTDGIPMPRLTAFNHSGNYLESNRKYQVLGMIRNDSDENVYNVEAISTLYNASGQTIDCKFTFTNNYNLLPGQFSAFELNFYGTAYQNVSSYKLQVAGDR